MMVPLTFNFCILFAQIIELKVQGHALHQKKGKKYYVLDRALPKAPNIQVSQAIRWIKLFYGKNKVTQVALHKKLLRRLGDPDPP